MAELNSFHVFVRDAVGETYCHSYCKNTPELVASAKEHARWWVGHVKRRAAQGKYKDIYGNRIGAPCGRSEVVVEFYHDNSAVAK